MRVLFYCFNSGGNLANLMILIKTLAKQYPQDTYYVAGIESSELARCRESGNIEIIDVRRGPVREWTRLRLCAGGLASLAKQVRADVIWSINIGPYHRTGIPQVLGLHNAYQVYPWAVARHHPRNRLGVAALRLFFRRSLRASDGVLAQTPLMAKYVSRIPRAPQRIAVFPKAVESAEDVVMQPLPERIVRQLDGGLGRGAFTFVYAAVGYPHKNHAVLVSAVRVLRGQGVKARIGLTVSADELISLAGREARSLVESGHLLTFGWVEKEHLRPLYDACHGCVMPSLLESLSSSHLEAMQWSKPQVVADLPYAHDLCGEAALYAEPKDPADWVAKMRMLVEDRLLGGRLAAAGLERMKSYPRTWREVARQVRDFLAEVADKR